MKKLFKYLLSTLAVCVLLSAWPAYKLYAELSQGASEDPLVWEEDIIALEQRAPAPAGAVLFMGSSSIKYWATLAPDMQPMTVVNRGFGGAKLADTVHYAKRLVDLEQPRAIVVFVGTNDITPGASKQPQSLLQSYRKLIVAIRTVHAATPVYYIAITPSPLRWDVWAVAQRTNALIQAYSATDPALHFIDTGPALLRDGKPHDEFYQLDGLHLSAAGYQVWTDIIRPRLINEVDKGKPQ